MPNRQGLGPHGIVRGRDLGSAPKVFEKIVAFFQSLIGEVNAIGQDLTVVENQVAALGVGTQLEATLTAQEPILTGQAVAQGGGGAVLADATNLNHISRVLGIAANDAAVGQNVTITLQGTTTVSGFSAGDVLWLGSGGGLTTVVPTTGFSIQVGIALNPTTALVRLSEPIELGGP